MKNQVIKNKNAKREREKIFFHIIQESKSYNVKLINNPYLNSFKKCTWKCLKCGLEFDQLWNSIQKGFLCPKCFPESQTPSIQENEIILFLKSLGFSNSDIEIKLSTNSNELVIYILSLKIAIEYNSLYKNNESYLDSYYYLNKTIECENQGIRLIHIFEDEWFLKKDIVKHRIKEIINKRDSQKIHARKCIIKEIYCKVKDEFLDNFHLQGKDISKIRLGAFYNNELVAVMTFSKSSISKGSKTKEKVWELNRFCTNYNYHIPGIASKLLSYFKRNYEWNEIFSYADRRWSQGNLYYKLGFELHSITQPNYWYIEGIKRIHRFNLRKQSYEPKDVTEWELRSKEGYSKVWDCGNLKFRIIKI
jgi:hypothetical protein